MMALATAFAEVVGERAGDLQNGRAMSSTTGTVAT